jgi:hypothetical protein
MSCCVPDHDICIVRGNSFSIGTGFTDDPYGIADDPALWTGELVLRAAKSDSVSPLLTMSSTVEEDLTVRPAGVPDLAWIMTFLATPAQTQALPPNDLYCHCEIVNATDQIRIRLWQGRVYMED